MSDLVSLAEKCERGSGPDREIDGLIAAATLPARSDGWKPWAMSGGYVLTETGDKPRPGMGQFVAAPHLTTSLDASVALLERVLPLAEWELTTTGFKPGATVIPNGAKHAGSYATSPARALLAAILRALAFKEPS